MFNFAKVEIRDEKTGMILSKNPYRLICHHDLRLVEWPVGSGNVWFEPDMSSGKEAQPAGRWINGAYDKKAKHVDYIPPKPLDAEEAQAKDQRIASLEREVEALRLERAKMTPAEKEAEKLFEEEDKRAAAQGAQLKQQAQSAVASVVQGKQEQSKQGKAKGA